MASQKLQQIIDKIIDNPNVKSYFLSLPDNDYYVEQAELIAEKTFYDGVNRTGNGSAWFVIIIGIFLTPIVIGLVLIGIGVYTLCTNSKAVFVGRDEMIEIVYKAYRGRQKATIEY